jgi:competence protein ComEA
MADELEDGLPTLRRPDRSRPSVASMRDWVDWFGPGRLIASTIAVVGVAVAGWWLVRPPSPPTESALPMASAPASAVAPSAPPTTAGIITVHVAGAVRRPGVYRLPSGSRVVDAIEQAGGTRARADTDAVNLAAPVADGVRVHVPVPGEVAANPPTSGEGTVGISLPPALVDINVADAVTLDSLPGVGPATAAAIIEYRSSHGPFGTVDDLESVPGIGPAKLDAVRDLVTV